MAGGHSPAMGAENLLDTPEKVQDAWDAQAVPHLQTPLVVVDNTGRFQHGEVLGDGRDVGPDQVAQGAHAPFAARELIDNEQPSRMGERFDDPGARGEKLSGRRIHTVPLTSIPLFGKIAK